MAMLSLVSAADLSSSERLVVGVDGDGKAALITAATAGSQIIGVIVDGGAASGDPVSVASAGEVAWVSAGAAVTAGAWVAAAAGSQVITTTTDTNNVLGRALTTSGADDDLIQVIVTIGSLSAA